MFTSIVRKDFVLVLRFPMLHLTGQLLDFLTEFGVFLFVLLGFLLDELERREQDPIDLLGGFLSSCEIRAFHLELCRVFEKAWILGDLDRRLLIEILNQTLDFCDGLFVAHR